MNIQELRELRAKKVAEADKLNADAGNWTAEKREASQATFDSIMEEIKAADQDIARFQAVLTATAQSQARVDALPTAASGDIKVGADREAERPFAHFGEQLKAIMAAGQAQENSPTADKRLLALNEKAIRAAAGSGARESVPEDGGFLVQQDFATELLSMADDDNNDVLRSRCTQRTISSPSNGLKINGLDETSRVNGSRYGGVRVYTSAELEQMTESKPRFSKIELKLDKLTGLFYASDEELQDVAFLEGEVTDLFQKEFRFKIQDLIYEGSGAGEPLGITAAGCTVTVAKETGQKATTVVTENISKMYSAMPAGMRSNAIWIINQDVEPQLDQMSVAVGTGGSAIYMPAGGIADAPYARLKGRPVIAIEQCETLGTAGDIMFVNMSPYLWATKGQIMAASSIHLKFDYNQTAFRWTFRVDGQPRFKKALTPFKGTGTLSPFVMLATRS